MRVSLSHLAVLLPVLEGIYVGRTSGQNLQSTPETTMRCLRFLLVFALLLSTLPARAFGNGTAIVFSGLTWSVSTGVSGLTSCNQLRLDASGDFVDSSSFALYGTYNCPALGGGYAATGVGYFDTSGLFNMTITFSNGWQITCVRLNASTMSGACGISNSVGASVGTALVNFTL